MYICTYSYRYIYTHTHTCIYIQIYLSALHIYTHLSGRGGELRSAQASCTSEARPATKQQNASFRPEAAPLPEGRLRHLTSCTCKSPPPRQ